MMEEEEVEGEREELEDLMKWLRKDK